jgi:hypothetical protein
MLRCDHSNGQKRKRKEASVIQTKHAGIDSMIMSIFGSNNYN